MKTTAFAFFIIFAMALNVHAGFRLPSGVYQIEELDQATEKSKSRGVPITFLISDTETKCGLCISASEEIIRELRARTVIVYTTNNSHLPGAVQSLIKGVDLGKYVPYAMIVNNELDRLIGVVRYDDIRSDGRKTFRELKRKIFEDKSPG
jgi:hypothetical protein